MTRLLSLYNYQPLEYVQITFRSCNIASFLRQLYQMLYCPTNAHRYIKSLNC